MHAFPCCWRCVFRVDSQTGGGSVRVQLQGRDLSPWPRPPERLPFSLEAGIFQTSVDCPEGGSMM